MNKKFKLYLKRIQPSVELCPDFWKIVESKQSTLRAADFIPPGLDISRIDCAPYFRIVVDISAAHSKLYHKKIHPPSLHISAGTYRVGKPVLLVGVFNTDGEWK